MLMPSIFGENFMDDFFGVPERTYTQSAQNALMKTDVVENKDGFDVSIDLPGFKKEDVKGEVKDGYLIITASTKQNKEEKNKIRRWCPETGDSEKRSKTGSKRSKIHLYCIKEQGDEN